MCTDLRLVRLSDLHVSGRTMDFAQDALLDVGDGKEPSACTYARPSETKAPERSACSTRSLPFSLAR